MTRKFTALATSLLLAPAALFAQETAPEAERIVRWNDPKFNIQWPIQPVVLSDKDAGAPDFDPKWHLGVG